MEKSTRYIREKGVPDEAVVGAAQAVPVGARRAEQEALRAELAEEALGGGAEAAEVGRGAEDGEHELVAVGLGRAVDEVRVPEEDDAERAEIGDGELEELEVLLRDAGDGVEADGDGGGSEQRTGPFAKQGKP